LAGGDALRGVAQYLSGLSKLAQVEHFERLGGRSVLHAQVRVPIYEGEGYFGITQIGDEMLVVVNDSVPAEICEEPVAAMNLVQFTAQPSGQATSRSCTDRTVTLVLTQRFFREIVSGARLDPVLCDLLSRQNKIAQSRCIPLTLRARALVENVLNTRSEGRLALIHIVRLSTELLGAVIAGVHPDPIIVRDRLH
jgi:hypothetical protein